MSERTFVRRFRDATGSTPGAWLIAQRLAVARELLETSELPMELIAAHSGMGSAANLRLHFRANIGVPASTYRGRFQRDPTTQSL